MSVKVRPYRGSKDQYEVDIRIELPDGSEVRERKKSPVSGKEASKRWGAARERELFDLAQRGELNRKEVPTVEAFWPRFVEGVLVAKKATRGTLRVKDSHFRNWILPAFGHIKLDQIGSEEVALFTAGLVAKKAADKILIVLYQILRAAFEWGIVSKMPTFIWPDRPTPKRNLFPPERFEELVDEAKLEGPDVLAFVLLAGEMGLRSGEIQGLWWESVNFPRGQITIERAIYENELGTTKTKESRSFKLTPRTLAALQAIRHLRGPYVFARENGRPWSADTIKRLMARLCRKLGVQKMGPHSLRHCAAQRMSLAGVPLDIIRQITGHRRLDVLQTYLHDSVEATGQVAARLAALDFTGPGEILEKGEGAKVTNLAKARRKRSSGAV